MINIADLWESCDPRAWAEALNRYWNYVRSANRALYRELDDLDLESLKRLDQRGWYDFLLQKYFRRKYTAANRYATSTRWLRQYAENDRLDQLDGIRKQLLSLNTYDVELGLKVAIQIKGLGSAGASGLLALMYPHAFGTVDQFVVKATSSRTELARRCCLNENESGSVVPQRWSCAHRDYEAQSGRE